MEQKLITKSSSETELMGVDDAISNILWSLYFPQEQGCDTTHDVICQDNESTILLESNGKISSGKCTKHIKATYFFITDKVANGDVAIKHIPTEHMWADMNTKPKQGIGYQTDRSLMMNCDVDLPVDPINEEDGGKLMTASRRRWPYPEDGRRSTVTPRVSWESVQECVGSTRHLGDQSGWLRVTSGLWCDSKRLFS